MTFNVTAHLKKSLPANAASTALCAALSLLLYEVNAQAQAPLPIMSSNVSQSQQNAPPRSPPPLSQPASQSPGQGPAHAQNQTFEEEIVPQRYANNPEVSTFIDNMVARYDFDPAMLHSLFANANYSATVVRLVLAAPAASKNWQAYQARFIDSLYINAGVSFWRANSAALQRASEQFGVPPEIIVGILGAETDYGRSMGNFPVLDTLTTLAFSYPDTPNRPEREALFRKNLEDFLVWTRETQINPLSVYGSYTGAIGLPQFLPSSIVKYAIDYEGNQRIDLRTSPADAIGSIANYLNANGWETARPVIWKIGQDPGSLGIAQAAANGQPEPHWTLAQLLRAGMLLNEPHLDLISESATPVTVIDLPTPGHPTQYVLGLKNFYVLTRYNRSFFYALAVYELGEKIKARMLANHYM